MPNFKSVVHFLLVDFGEGCCYLLSCDGGKTKSTPSPTDLDWTVRLDWSLTIITVYKHTQNGIELGEGLAINPVMCNIGKP